MPTLNQYLRKAVATAAQNPDAPASPKESGILAKLFGAVAAPVAQLGEKALVRPFLPANERIQRGLGQAEGMNIPGVSEPVQYLGQDPMGEIAATAKVADVALMASGLYGLGKYGIGKAAQKAGSMLGKKVATPVAEEIAAEVVSKAKAPAKKLLALPAGKVPQALPSGEKLLLPEVTQTRAALPEVIQLGAGKQYPKELAQAINKVIKKKTKKTSTQPVPKAQGVKVPKPSKQVPLSPKPQPKPQAVPFELLEEAESLGFKSLEGQDVSPQALRLKERYLALSKEWPEEQRMQDYRKLLELLGENLE